MTKKIKIQPNATTEDVKPVGKYTSSDEVLDKIRAEIEHHRRKTKYIDPYDLVGDCLDIIDKYKAESEEGAEE